MLCFLETPVLRFALLSYYKCNIVAANVTITSRILKGTLSGLKQFLAT